MMVQLGGAAGWAIVQNERREEEEERAGLFFTSRGHHTLGRSVPKSRFSMGEVAFMTAILLA